MTWPSGRERILEVSEEMLSRIELLKLSIFARKLSYKGRESEGGVWQRRQLVIDLRADDGKGFEAQRSMSQSEGSL